MEQFVEYLKWVSFLLFQSWLWAPLRAGLGSGGHGQGWAGSQCLGEVGSSWDCRASIEEETTLMWLESHWKCSDPMSCPVGGARTHCVAVFASGCLRSEKFHWLSPRALTWAPCWVGYIKAPLFSLELCHSLNHSSFPFAMGTLLLIQQLFSAHACLPLKRCAAKLSRNRGHSSSVCAMSAFCAVCPWWISVLGQMLLVAPEAELVMVLLLGSAFVSAATVVSDSEKTFEPPTHT